MSVVLVAAGAAIFLLLGVAHGVFSLQSTPDAGPMMPTDPDVRQAMMIPGGLGLAPELQTTLYRSWIGFNLSHSLGVIVVAGLLFWHAVSDLAAVVDQPWFLVIAGLTPPIYLFLAIKYWFDKPRDGIALGMLLIWAGIAIELL